MYNIKSMKICNSTNNLFKIATSFFLINFGIFNNKIKKLTILNILHNEKQMPTSLNNLIKLNNRWVPD